MREVCAVATLAQANFARVAESSGMPRFGPVGPAAAISSCPAWLRLLWPALVKILKKGRLWTKQKRMSRMGRTLWVLGAAMLGSSVPTSQASGREGDGDKGRGRFRQNIAADATLGPKEYPPAAAALPGFGQRKRSLIARTRLVTTASKEYLGLLQNWAHWVRRLGFTEFTVVAEDSEAFTYLTAKPAEFPEVLDAAEVLSEPDTPEPHSVGSMAYDKPGFFHLVGRRPTYLAYLLRHWQYVLYSDADIVWLRNPFTHLVGDVDMELSVDAPEHLGMQPYFCTGLMFLRNTSRTLTALKSWDSRLERRAQLNQPAFNRAVRGRQGKLRVRARELDSRLFASGFTFFLGLGSDCRGQAITAHANWVVGIEQKIELLESNGLWFGEGIPCWWPEVLVIADDGSRRCVVEDFSCVPRASTVVSDALHVGALRTIAVFDAYIATDGSVLDTNGRLYYNGHDRLGITASPHVADRFTMLSTISAPEIQSTAARRKLVAAVLGDTITSTSAPSKLDQDVTLERLAALCFSFEPHSTTCNGNSDGRPSVEEVASWCPLHASYFVNASAWLSSVVEVGGSNEYPTSLGSTEKIKQGPRLNGHGPM